MNPEAMITLSVLSLVLALLIGTRWAPHIILLGGLTILLTVGVSSADTKSFRWVSAARCVVRVLSMRCPPEWRSALTATPC